MLKGGRVSYTLYGALRFHLEWTHRKTNKVLPDLPFADESDALFSEVY